MKTKQRPTTRAEREAKNPVILTGKFTPRFWESCDGRHAVVREITRRYDRLMKHTGADSFQKELLCQRAIFLAVRLETMECEAAETGELDTGVYTQAVNGLSGLLSKLGLEKQAQKVAKSLKSHMKEKYQQEEEEDD